MVDLKSQIKVEYIRCNFDKLSEAFAEHEKGSLFAKKNAEEFAELNDIDVITYQYRLYRKVETEITAMQAAKDACENYVNQCIAINIGENVITDFIRGGSYLFEREVVHMCRAIVNAYDGKSDEQ